MLLKNLIGIKVHHSRRALRSHGFYARRWGKMTGFSLLLLEKGRMALDRQDTRIVAMEKDILSFDRESLREVYGLPGGKLSYRVIIYELISDTGAFLTPQDIGLPPIIRSGATGPVMSLFNRIHERFCRRWDDDRLPACSGLALELFSALAKLPAIRETTSGRPRDLHYRIRQTLDFIRGNLRKKLPVSDLARRVYMNPEYFTRLFKEQVGLPPSQYILERKIEKAKDYLLEFDEPLSNTAQELGFHDYSHFFRTFKRLTGTTPLRYFRSIKRKYDPR